MLPHQSERSFIVGYMGNKSNDSGNTMMAPTFLSVGSETGCTLADLTETGYEAPILVNEEDGEWEGGCAGGGFILNFLTSEGKLDARYYWIDNGETGPGWYANAGGKAITGGASSVVISAGQGVWILGRGMTLQSAGKVNELDVAMKMNTSGNTACGNGTPIDLTLAKLTVEGYSAPVLVNEEDGEWEGGCAGGGFILNFLTSEGKLDARYYWIDNGETGPGWYANAGGKEIVGGAASVAFPAGQGVWVLGRGMTLRIPGPEL